MAPPQGFQWQLMVTCNGAGSSYELIARLDKLAARPGYQVIYSVGWDGHLGRGNPASRPAAMYASAGSGHGHTMAMGDTAPGSLPATVAKRRRGGIAHISTGAPTILARTSTSRQQHAERARPGTRPECSGNQAIKHPVNDLGFGRVGQESGDVVSG